MDLVTVLEVRWNCDEHVVNAKYRTATNTPLDGLNVHICTPTHVPGSLFAFWIPIMAFESVLFLLALHKGAFTRLLPRRKVAHVEYRLQPHRPIRKTRQLVVPQNAHRRARARQRPLLLHVRRPLPPPPSPPKSNPHAATAPYTRSPSRSGSRSATRPTSSPRASRSASHV